MVSCTHPARHYLIENNQSRPLEQETRITVLSGQINGKKYCSASGLAGEAECFLKPKIGLVAGWFCEKLSELYRSGMMGITEFNSNGEQMMISKIEDCSGRMENAEFGLWYSEVIELG